ncbi:MAG: hypothetical protein ACPGQR_04445, partial [Marinirhabdus sp.]
DEMALSDIFDAMGNAFYKLVGFLFLTIDFFIKYWAVVLLIIVGSAVYGYYKTHDEYTAELITKVNFKGHNYVYNAIGQLNDNIAEGDAEFMESVGLDPGENTIKSISIEPIIDAMGIVRSSSDSDRSLEYVVKELSAEEDVELFATDKFYVNYMYHRLKIKFNGGYDLKHIEKITNFINNTPFAKELAAKGKYNSTERIANLEASLQQFDNLLEGYAENLAPQNAISEKSTFYNNQNQMDFSALIQAKSRLISEIERLKNYDIAANGLFLITSAVQAVKTTKTTDKKYITYPIALLFIFLLLGGTIHFYRTMRVKLNERKTH